MGNETRGDRRVAEKLLELNATIMKEHKGGKARLAALTACMATLVSCAVDGIADPKTKVDFVDAIFDMTKASLAKGLEEGDES